MFGADEAKAMGLVNRSCPTTNSTPQSRARGPTFARSDTRAVDDEAPAQQCVHFELAEALEAEAMAQAVNSSTDDTKEGLLAFLEKRDASFKGR
jgi:enoyl-CoA hydratase/carnithine racemase